MIIEITTEVIRGEARPRYLLRLSNIDGVEVRVPLGEMSREDADRIATQIVEFIGCAYPGTAVLGCPLDTARLEFLMARYNMTRESVDAWANSAPKLASLPTEYRPWTREEGHGKTVVHPNGDWQLLICTSTDGAFVMGRTRSWGEIFRYFSQPNGTPCGARVPAATP